MGWGKKTTGAKPQPAIAPSELLDTETPFAEGTIPSEEEAIEDAKDRKSDAAKAEMSWSQLRSRKGWVPETVALLLYEFVKERDLFEDLIAFAKKRK